MLSNNKFLGKCFYGRHPWMRLAMESESMVEKGMNFIFCLGTAYDISSMESVGSSNSSSLVGKVCLSKCFYLSIFALSSGTSKNPYFPLWRAYILLFSIYFYAKSQSFSLYSFLFFSFGKHHVVRKDLGTYIHLDVGFHKLLLLTLPLR